MRRDWFIAERWCRRLNSAPSSKRKPQILYRKKKRSAERLRTSDSIVDWPRPHLIFSRVIFKSCDHLVFLFYIVFITSFYFFCCFQFTPGRNEKKIILEEIRRHLQIWTQTSTLIRQNLHSFKNEGNKKKKREQSAPLPPIICHHCCGWCVSDFGFSFSLVSFLVRFFDPFKSFDALFIELVIFPLRFLRASFFFLFFTWITSEKIASKVV